MNVHSYLNSFVNFESRLHDLRPEDFSLDRIRKFLDLAGNPHKNLKIVHVAGTKGKGSTCALLAYILQEAGYTVGLYTSPHLHRVNERIRILNKADLGSRDDFCGSISDDDLEKTLADLRPFAAAIRNDGHVLTYFEVLTVAALSYFSKQKMDIVILETGLGGRLDATNAAEPFVAVITPISLDHMAILGSTLGQIAGEKAGIIKDSRQKVVIAPQEKEAMEVILKRCREFGVQPVMVEMGDYKGLQTALRGKHQIRNAATAVETLKILRTQGFNITDEAIGAGLKNVRWPGRFESLASKPEIIVDGAHNGASAQALAETFKEHYPGRKVILVLGISKDKDVKAICFPLNEIADRIFLTRASHPRAYAFSQAEASKLFQGKSVTIIEHLKEALEKALSAATPQDVVLITGSFFTVAEAREQLCTSIKG